MKRARDIERMVQDLCQTVDAEAHDRIIGRLLGALKQQKQTQSAARQPHTGRLIMKSPMAKLAVAAAIVAAVVLGLFEFISTDSGSGVVWAEVTQKVQACPGVIYRGRGNRSDSEHSVNYLSATRNRKDIYEGGQITVSHYLNFETMIASSVNHVQKWYWRDAPLGEQNAQEHDKVSDPKWLIQSILSCEHQKLGEKTIEGVRCEGLETSDPAVLGKELPGDIDIRMELWVSVETNYPVLCEGNVTAAFENQTHTSEWVLDQFQWDVELDPSVFEPNISSDYEER
jgi:hypothetical protein